MTHDESTTSWDFAEVPDELRAQRRWLLWRRVVRDSDGKATKVPVDDAGAPVDVTDANIWRSFPEAVGALGRARECGLADGLGVVLGNRLAGVDLDNVRDPATGALTAVAENIVRTLDSYTEISPSSTGNHVLVWASLPNGCRHRAPLPGGGHVEVYDHGRYFTFTGRRLPNTPPRIEERTEVLARLCVQWGLLSPPTASATATMPMDTTGDTDAGEPDLDVLLVERERKVNKYFAALWSGDVSGYPSASEADLALCVRLLQLVGGDVRRADTLFRRSGLYRPKWDERHRGDGATYGQLTLETARRAYRERLQEPVLVPSRTDAPPTPDVVGENGWEPPIPLDIHDAPDFPTDVLPPTLREFVRHVAAARQVPADLPGTLVLAALAAAARRTVTVTVHDGWTEPLSLYTVSVLPSGERKTPVFADVTAPLAAWEQRRAQALEATIAAATRKTILEQQLRHAEARAAKARPGTTEAQAALTETEALARELSGLAVPARPRLLVDDVTPEALGKLLAEHGGRRAVFADEGDLFDLMRGRYGNGPNFGVYLRAHVGSPLRIDRVGRPPVHVRWPALTVGITVQPAVLHGLQHDPHLRGRGLLARFLYAWPRSLVGRRQPDAPPMPAGVRARYHALISLLLDRLATWTPAELADGADAGEGGEDGADAAPVCLRLADDAYRLLVRFQAELEPHIGPDGELAPLADWTNKLPGTVARLAALLHLADWAETGAVGYPATHPVDAVTMARAITLGRYYLAHARYAFTAMGADPHLETAAYLWRRIAADGGVSCRRRDLLRLARRFASVSEIEAPLRLLIRYGYLREESTPAVTGPASGRPSGPHYLVNPLARRGGGGGDTTDDAADPPVLSFLSRLSRGVAPAIAPPPAVSDLPPARDKTDTTDKTPLPLPAAPPVSRGDDAADVGGQRDKKDKKDKTDPPPGRERYIL
jgi:hypothetical protein